MSDVNQLTVVTPFQPGKVFWATGTKNSRRTAIAATAIVVLLALISCLVWMSPSDSLVRRAVGVAVAPITGTAKLENEKADLQTQLVSARSTVSQQSSRLKDQSKALQEALGKAKALQAELATASKAGSISAGQAASYKAQLAALEAHLGAGTGTGADAVQSASPPVQSAGGGDGADGIGPVTVVTPSRAQLLDPATRYFGLYTAQSPFDFAEFDQVAHDVGREPNVAGYFQGWDQPFRADALQKSWARGDLPMMTWESQASTAANNDTDQTAYSLGNIIRGDFDAYLTTYARAVAANGQPMAIRLDQEMNATWYPWSEGQNGNTPGQFRQMWIHVWDIFQAEGANKYVIWDWSPNRVDNLVHANKQLSYTRELYPGPQYVDWVGMSGYERPNAAGVQQDGTFATTFGKTLAQLRTIALGKKIMLSEIGAAEEGAPSTATSPSLKQEWITNFFAALADPANSDIIGFSWFNLTVTTNVNQDLASNDWRITSTAASIAAFAAGIARTDTDYALRPATS